MVEELLPALVTMVAQVDVDEWVVFGFDGPSNKFHPGELGGPASFLDVAGCAGANNIVPG